ncbi:MAG: hypothetical protein P4L52_08120 [Acidocella sp.]|nr:hypothetical protein [Acidocella sp.]
MTRLPLACVFVLALSGAAFAQTSATTTGSATTTKSGGQTGIAKPPAGTLPPQHFKRSDSDFSNLGGNVPTLPTIAQHPTATIGSPVEISGPGGTTQSPVGMPAPAVRIPGINQ